ncbi:mRNA transport regulator 3 [Rhizoctonia solani AG-1 IA]|uniref:mRNA transport regulator 3 n=1 Tax=Thanatephorus cucumeris (strain AG1-IA) TaxID=983506 RepID=L8X4Q4_THACA|nr:mRNA transport regulator 3 [Rhizoctonia solani AG-1 IA]
MAQHSNFDRRRINGPESSSYPIFENNEEDKIPTISRTTRKNDEIRPISKRTGQPTSKRKKPRLLSQCRYGPREIKAGSTYTENGRLKVEVKFSPFSCKRRRAPIRDAESPTLASQIHQSLLPAVRLELFPKSQLDVYVHILEVDGIESCVGAAATAASAALADAGIDMLGLAVSCTAAINRSVTGYAELLLDPNGQEADAARGLVMVTCLPALGTVTNMIQTGLVHPDEVIQCMDVCTKQCEDIHFVVAQSLLESAQTRSRKQE